MSTKATHVLFILLSVFFAHTVFASETVGTIDTAHKYGWGENTGWVNFAPTNGDGYTGLTITDTAITGYAWSKEFGWINFSPTNSGQGVQNTSEGQLSGSAWAAALGWISMDGVTIDETGAFTGIAGTTNQAGRISFDCDNCSVTTDWRPVSARLQSQEEESSTGSRSGGYINQNIVIPNVAGVLGEEGGTPGNTGDPIALLYKRLGLILPDRTAASDYVESYDSPLEITPTQHGLLVYTFPDGSSVIIVVPKHAREDSMTIEITTLPSTSAHESSEMIIVGGVTFTITAKDSRGNTIHTFLQPLQITLAVPDPLAGEKDLGLYWFDTEKTQWVLIPDAVFFGTTVTFSVSHLTEFAIMRSQSVSQTIPIKNLDRGELSDNPFSFPLWPFIAAGVFIIIYWYIRNRTQEHT